MVQWRQIKVAFIAVAVCSFALTIVVANASKKSAALIPKRVAVLVTHKEPNACLVDGQLVNYERTAGAVDRQFVTERTCLAANGQFMSGEETFEVEFR